MMHEYGLGCERDFAAGAFWYGVAHEMVRYGSP